MGFQGVFRDDFYNASNVLTEAQANNGPSTTGTLTAAIMAGACECNIGVGNGQTTLQTYTTDTAVNIIAQLQQAVAVAVKAAPSGFAAGVNPPAGTPNLFNVSWIVNLNNTGITAASALAAGTGVTLTGYTALTATSLPAAAAAGSSATTVYVMTVTSPTTVTMFRVQ